MHEKLSSIGQNRLIILTPYVVPLPSSSFLSKPDRQENGSGRWREASFFFFCNSGSLAYALVEFEGRFLTLLYRWRGLNALWWIKWTEDDATVMMSYFS
mmetsp:Transcript_37448/g.68799  ORF Transcript_37448/g.68799 Transcript_37448/m.68799 type:complete len:99 (-) Transcript_37448:60-356(-)